MRAKNLELLEPLINYSIIEHPMIHASLRICSSSNTYVTLEPSPLYRDKWPEGEAPWSHCLSVIIESDVLFITYQPLGYLGDPSFVDHWNNFLNERIRIARSMSKSPRYQRYFDSGIALYHSYWSNTNRFDTDRWHWDPQEKIVTHSNGSSRCPPNILDIWLRFGTN